jgi:hypothetical protein
VAVPRVGCVSYNVEKKLDKMQLGEGTDVTISSIRTDDKIILLACGLRAFESRMKVALM